MESRLTALYEKLLTEDSAGTENESYDKSAFNPRTRAFYEALRRGLINSDELEKASAELSQLADPRPREIRREDKADRK